MHGYLMVAAGQVQSGEVLGSDKRIKGLLDPWQWVGVTDRLGIQALVVDAPMKAAILPPGCSGRALPLVQRGSFGCGDMLCLSSPGRSHPGGKWPHV